MNVGEIVASVDVVQSTVSAHLKALVEMRFVLSGDRHLLLDQPRLRSLLPTAAGIAMGRPVPAQPIPISLSWGSTHGRIPAFHQSRYGHRPLLRPGPYRPGRWHHYRL